MVNKFIGCDSEFKEADIVLFGVAFDATSTYRRGSKFAPMAIRNESRGIETYSPYLDKDLEDIKVFDGANIDVGDDIEKMLSKTEEYVAQILAARKFPLMLGGEHLVTLGAFRAISKKYPKVCVIHFDAHTDLRNDWEGNLNNHSTVIRRCFDIVGKDRIFQFGIRSGEKTEFEFAKKNTVLIKNNFDGLEKILKKIGKSPVYFTVDLDVLDPSEFGGTGTPEAGGVSFLELLNAAQEVFKYNVVGCDINELSPPFDTNGASTALACKFLREVLLLAKK